MADEPGLLPLPAGEITLAPSCSSSPASPAAAFPLPLAHPVSPLHSKHRQQVMYLLQLSQSTILNATEIHSLYQNFHVKYAAVKINNSICDN